MFGFLIKKSFFDMWDNILPFLLMNIVYVVLAGLELFIFSVFGTNPFLFRLAEAPLIIAAVIFAAAASKACREVADGGRISLRDLPGYIKFYIKPSLAVSAVIILDILLVTANFLAFSNTGSLGLFVSNMTLFWMNLFLLCIFQYFFPVITNGSYTMKETIHNSIFFFVDNTPVSIGILLFSSLLAVISLVTFFFLPGVTAILLLHQNAHKLLGLKYSYMEKNPQANRRKLPWNEILEEEKEILGPRGFKDIIFPWKM